jgi:anti-sigma regulatory factor (Ser/Thr protein kinase)
LYCHNMAKLPDPGILKCMMLPLGLEQAVSKAVFDAIRFDLNFFKLPVADSKDVEMQDYMIDASSTDETYTFMEELEEELVKRGATPKAAYELVYSSMEAVNNSREHSYNFEKGKKVYIHVDYTPFFDKVSIMSFGKTIPEDIIDDRRNRDVDMLHNKDRGRGIAIMKQLCDIVSIDVIKESSYSEVNLTKFKGEYYIRPN